MAPEYGPLRPKTPGATLRYVDPAAVAIRRNGGDIAKPCTDRYDDVAPVRIAFDLDGTVADLQTALARIARDLFPDVDAAMLPRSAAPEGDPTSAQQAGPPAEGDQPTAARALTTRQQRELWQVVCARHNFWETLDEIEPGILARLSDLARERRWEIIFLTSRPETAGDLAQMQSHRWLTAHGVAMPSVFVVHGSRGRIAAALHLDAFVDDRPENCLDIAIDSTARPILVWRGDEAQIPASARQLGIGVVPSITACLDIFEKIGRPATGEDVGVLERLKRLLGLKPRAARLREVLPGAVPAAKVSAADRPAPARR